MEANSRQKRSGYDDLRAYFGMFVAQALAAELGGIALALSGQHGYLPLVASTALLLVYLMTSPLIVMLLVSASIFELGKLLRLFGTAVVYFGLSSTVLWSGHLDTQRFGAVAWLTIVPTLMLWLFGRAPARSVQSAPAEPFVPLRERLKRAEATEPIDATGSPGPGRP